MDVWVWAAVSYAQLRRGLRKLATRVVCLLRREKTDMLPLYSVHFPNTFSPTLSALKRKKRKQEDVQMASATAAAPSPGPNMSVSGGTPNAYLKKRKLEAQ